MDNSIDTVLLLDVMEHLPFPDRALKEIHRVLKPQGLCILQIPFLYPIHDAPLDFQRWTCYGLKIVITQQGFTLKDLTPRGKPLETTTMLLNIALTKSVSN